MCEWPNLWIEQKILCLIGFGPANAGKASFFACQSLDASVRSNPCPIKPEATAGLVSLSQRERD